MRQEFHTCWHALRGAGLGWQLTRGGGRWPYPALRCCNRSAIGTGSGCGHHSTLHRLHTAKVTSPLRHTHAGACRFRFSGDRENISSSYAE